MWLAHDLTFCWLFGGTTEPRFTSCDLCCVVQAAMWQMSFLVGPSALPDINYNLQIDEDVLRWVVVKKRQHPVRPNTHVVAKTAEKKLSEQHVHMLDREQQHVAPH